MPQYRAGLSAVLVALGVIASASALAQESTPLQESTPVQAIWKPQEISFYFQSFTTFYSCDGLESKIERILRALGAKDPKVKVRSADCPWRVARMPRVVIDVRSPIEATPEAIAERDKNKSTRELTARVQGKGAEAAEEAEQFAAIWRRVALSRGELNLEPGDCELIDELRRKVLPKLAVRIMNDDVSCSPHSLTIGQPRLEVEALVEAPKPDDQAPKQE